MVKCNAINYFSAAKWVVSKTPGLGTHTTIASAIAASSPGDVIAIVPDTAYVENLTFTAGIILTSAVSGAYNGTVAGLTNYGVSITGVHKFPSSGFITISGIQFNNSTTTSIFTDVTSSTNTANFYNCQFNATTGGIFGLIVASGTINCYDCYAQNSTGTLLAINTGTINIYNSTFSSLTATPAQSVFGSGSTFLAVNSNIQFPLNLTAMNFYAYNCNFGAYTVTFKTGTNSTLITTLTSGIYNCYKCTFASGTSVAISIGTGTTIGLYGGTDIKSSATNVISGAGTLNYSNLTFSGTSSGINVTTQVGGIAKGGAFQTPSAGFIGEQIRAVLASGSAISLTTATPANITSISLTPGIWSVSGLIQFAGTPTTSGVQQASINNVSITHGTVGDNSSQASWNTTNFSVGSCPIVIPNYVYVLTATTTIYLVASGVFSSGTMTAYGRINALRIA